MFEESNAYLKKISALKDKEEKIKNVIEQNRELLRKQYNVDFDQKDPDNL